MPFDTPQIFRKLLTVHARNRERSIQEVYVYVMKREGGAVPV